MFTELSTISVPGLSKEDKEVLENIVSTHQVTDEYRLEDQTRNYDELGEPGTAIFAGILTSAIVGVIGSWLLKKRVSKKFTHLLEIKHRDGTVIRKFVSYDSNLSESPKEQIMKQLSEMTEIPVVDILEKIFEEE